MCALLSFALTRTFACMHVRIYVFMHSCAHVCTYICMRVYAHMCGSRCERAPGVREGISRQLSGNSGHSHQGAQSTQHHEHVRNSTHPFVFAGACSLRLPSASTRDTLTRHFEFLNLFARFSFRRCLKLATLASDTPVKAWPSFCSASSTLSLLANSINACPANGRPLLDVPPSAPPHRRPYTMLTL